MDKTTFQSYVSGQNYASKEKKGQGPKFVLRELLNDNKPATDHRCADVVLYKVVKFFSKGRKDLDNK